MIDCHVHTKRSHHGEGDIEDFVLKAIDRGFEIIGFSEHAPFLFDSEHRLTKEEIRRYLDDVVELKIKYSNQIKILSGLEVDYHPSAESYLTSLLPLLECDFRLGSVHFFDSGSSRFSVWDYNALQRPEVIDSYFASLDRAVASGFFDVIAHPDIILRSGVRPSQINGFFLNLVASMKQFCCAYEINCSGLTKSSYDLVSRKKVYGAPSYPNIEIAALAHSEGVPLVIGSDAHSPDYLGANVLFFIQELKKRGITDVTYFEKRTPHMFSLEP
ncbi:MAG: histidinol-phosphatase [archaeon]